MKDGQRSETQLTKPVEKQNKHYRIYEFVQGTNKMFSNKRLLALIYTAAAIGYAFYAKDPVIVGIFATAATGSSVSGMFEKKID